MAGSFIYNKTLLKSKRLEADLDLVIGSCESIWIIGKIIAGKLSSCKTPGIFDTISQIIPTTEIEYRTRGFFPLGILLIG